MSSINRKTYLTGGSIVGLILFAGAIYFWLSGQTKSSKSPIQTQLDPADDTQNNSNAGNSGVEPKGSFQLPEFSDEEVALAGQVAGVIRRAEFQAKYKGNPEEFVKLDIVSYAMAKSVLSKDDAPQLISMLADTAYAPH